MTLRQAAPATARLHERLPQRPGTGSTLQGVPSLVRGKGIAGAEACRAGRVTLGFLLSRQ